MSVMKIAGNANNVVTGVAVTTDGNVITNKAWENNIISIYDDMPTSAGTYRAEAISDGNAGAFSLRVTNSTDQDITLGLYTDVLSNHYALRDASGQLLQYIIEAGKSNIAITPDDWPQLQWLAKLRVYFTIPTASEGKKVTIHAVVKR